MFECCEIPGDSGKEDEENKRFGKVFIDMSLIAGTELHNQRLRSRGEELSAEGWGK